MWKGSLKNVAIWERALTATEVQNVMYKTYPEVSGRLGDSTLVSWWSLESTGTPISFADSHGSNTGTNSGAIANNDLYGGDTPVKPRAIDNAPTVQADAIGTGSALLNGDTDYISIADDSTLDITTDITISCWVKVSSFDTDYDGLVTKDDNGGVGYALYIDKGASTSTGTAKFAPRRYDGQLAISGSLNINTWYHIVGTHESGSVDENKIYINGVLADTTADTTSMAANSNDLQIGKQFEEGNYNLNGNICQVGIWDAALTQAQIQSIMEKTYAELIASEKEDLVSWYPLDAVANLAAGSGNVKDSHGSNHGTLA